MLSFVNCVVIVYSIVSC